MVLLQTQLNSQFSELLNNMLDYSSQTVATSFSGIFDEMQTYAYGIAAVGLLSGMLPAVLGYMFSGHFPFDTLFKYLLMAGLFVNYPSLIRLADNVFKQPAARIEAKLDVQTDGGNVLIQKYVDAYNDGINKQYEEDNIEYLWTLNSGGMIGNTIQLFFKKLLIYIWMALAMLINLLLDVVMFLMKFASIFGAELLIALSPLSFGISFVRGFEGSLVGVLKYIFVFRLWGAVASAIKFAAYNVGFFEMVYQFHGSVDSGAMPSSPDWGPLVLQAAFIVLMMLTPMFSDALISGTQAGPFLNAAVAKGAGMVQTFLKGHTGGSASPASSPTSGKEREGGQSSSKGPGGGISPGGSAGNASGKGTPTSGVSGGTAGSKGTRLERFGASVGRAYQRIATSGRGTSSAPKK